MKTETTKLMKTARFISVGGHPFVLLALTMLIFALRDMSAPRALTTVAITLFVTIIPLLLIIRRQVAAGNWSDHDVSDASERKSFYPLAITVASISLIVFYVLDFERGILLGILVSLLLLLAAMFINRRSKISLHVTFAVYFAVSLLALNIWTGALFLAFAALIGWSRVRLERHSTAQVLAGAALGAAGGILLFKLAGLF